jgi:hypothetical protein
MVDISQRRFEKAKEPSEYKHFVDWLDGAVKLPGLIRSGLQRQLAAYVQERLGDDTQPQHVTKWLKGSIPEIPKLRAIAEWARVDFADLKELVDKQLEDRQTEPRARSGGRVASKKSGRRSTG